MVSGPVAVTFSAPNQLATAGTFMKSGTHLLRLTANDAQYIPASDVTITVTAPNPGNQAPVVKARCNAFVGCYKKPRECLW
jgi:hypothetical protein